MSLFGSLNINTNASQPQQTGGGSLFGASQQRNGNQQQNQQGSSLFGQPQPQQHSQLQQSNVFSGAASANQPQSSFGGSTLIGSQQPDASQYRASSSSLWQPGSSLSPREKTVPERMQTLLEKWSPNSPKCQFTTYFYNSVGSERMPYFGPQPGEDEQKWEDALAKKPDAGSIPVLSKGFFELGNRLRLQVQTVQVLQSRLHEINNSLKAQQQEHELRISIRAADAKRRHAQLSQRALALATRVQVLKNRGYGLDSAEETLKAKLVELENKAADPSISSRQDEMWAKMLNIRERAKTLQAESEKAGQALADNSDGGIDEEVLKRAKKILSDYDSQIGHLTREIQEIRKDFDEWEGVSTNG